ncbi:MAG: ABC-2 transporter permease [Oscillospiraceae bacterium]|nr:ABC-2 transporter permease [Oscillospiraceae bacterium]
MSGLLWKDLLVLKKGAKVYLALMVFYTVLGAVQENNSMMGAMAVIIVMIVPLNCFSWDNLAKWDTYAMALPVSRRAIVGGRYLCMLLISAVSLTYVLLTGVVQALVKHDDWLEPVLVGLACLAVALVIDAIMLPVVYKFGPEKARFIILPIVGLPTGLSAFLALQSKRGNITLPDLSWLEAYLPVALPVGTVLAVLASFLISCRIYEKKEA